MDNDKLNEIKRVALFFYTSFYDELRDRDVALELTKEAMTTYRTMMINEERSREKQDMITHNQLNYIKSMLGDFNTASLVQEELNRLGKPLERLTKQEASDLITRVKRGDGREKQS